MSVLKIKDANGNWQNIPAIKGADGINGTNGVDGISPIATVSKSGDTATISITDKNGTTTTTISDGTNGTNGTNGRDGYVQYTAGNNITIDENNVISATGGDLTNYVKIYTTTTKDTNSAEFRTAFQNMLTDYLNNITSLVYININTSSNRDYKNFYKIDTFSYGRYFCSAIMDLTRVANATTTSRIEGDSISYSIYATDGVITSIQDNGITYYEYSNFLATDRNYSTPYTPLYDGSPATKKYAESMVENIAPLYSSSSTYDEGDYVSYQGKLYVCSTTISIAENWTAAHWTQTTVVDILGDINTILATLTTPQGGNER